MKRLLNLGRFDFRVILGLFALSLSLLLAASLIGCSSLGNYQNTDLEVGFSYPANWTRQDTQQIAPLFVSPDGVANVGVTKEILPQVMTTDAYFAALNQQLQTKGYILCGTRQTQMGNSSGIQAVYLNKGLIQVFTIVTKGQTAWSLIETTKAEGFMDWAQTFNEIVRSFKVLS
jgi:hypothetical protein